MKGRSILSLKTPRKKKPGRVIRKGRPVPNKPCKPVKKQRKKKPLANYKKHPAWDYLLTSEPVKQSKPFAIGFRDQALEARPEGMPKKPIRRLLSLVARSNEYLNNLVEGGPRFNWDNTENGQVEPDHQEHAKEQLAKRREQ